MPFKETPLKKAPFRSHSMPNIRPVEESEKIPAHPQIKVLKKVYVSGVKSQLKRKCHKCHKERRIDLKDDQIQNADIFECKMLKDGRIKCVDL